MASENNELIEWHFNDSANFGREQKKKAADPDALSLRNVWAVIAGKFTADDNFTVSEFPGQVLISSRNSADTLSVSDNRNGTFRIDTLHDPVGLEKTTDDRAPAQTVIAVLGRYHGRHSR